MDKEKIRTLLECEDSDSYYDDKSDSEAEKGLVENTHTEKECVLSDEFEQILNTIPNYYADEKEIEALLGLILLAGVWRNSHLNAKDLFRIEEEDLDSLP